MLFRRATLERIAKGEITLAFRRWTRPSVRAGGTLKTRVGLLAIDAVETISTGNITEREAKLAGSESKSKLIDELNYRNDGTVYRVKFHLAGPDPRIGLRRQSKLKKDDLAQLSLKLSRLDNASGRGPWTSRYLRLIKQYPARRAGDLADMEGMIKPKFKINVRKLKNLGLTESLEVGYRLSPRGRAYLRSVQKSEAEGRGTRK
jgi:hypothetical protein